MDTALQVGLTNIAVAALIALVAAGASLIRSRPALAHALWLLVILKLLTPPLWGVQFDWRWARAIQPTVEPPTAEQSREANALAPAAPRGPIAQFTPRIESAALMPDETQAESEAPQPETASPAPAAPPHSIRSRDLIVALARWLPVVATLLWLFGSMVCAAVILLRVVCFHRLLRFATLASPALQGRAAALARRMGLAHSPRVWFVPGAVSPMLWPLGRSPRVLIPSQLWDRLGEGQRSSLLAHELAHLRRRDHWVRLPEVLVSVLYWWCPLMWFARRRLREAEEQCCDAWVVWALPDAARDYASALLETVDFVTAAGGRAPLPVLASGMGQFHQLRRRLVMIKHARIPRSLSGPGWLAVGALALGLLPIAPSLAQVDVSTTPPADPRNVASEVVPVTPAPPVAPTPARVSVQTTPVAVGAPEAVTATVAEIAPIAAAPAPDAPEADASIINDLKSKPVPKNANAWGSKSATGYASGDPRLDKAREEARNEVYELSIKLKLAEQRLKDLEMAAGKQMKADVTAKLSRGGSKGEVPATPGAPTPPPMAPGYYPDKTNFENAYGSSYGKARLDRNATRENRLDAIEANLKALLDEVHALREKPSSSDPAPRFKEQAK